MRRLMLLRHAKTEHDAPSGHDQDRRLDDRGRLDAAAVGGWIGRHLPIPEVVLVSTAVRAQQTWDLAWLAMKDRIAAPRVEHLDELYGAEPTQLLKILRLAEAQAPKQIMLVGHNPGLHDFVLRLTREDENALREQVSGNLPTAAAVMIELPANRWNEVEWGSGQIRELILPRELS